MATHLVNDAEIGGSEVLNCIDISNTDINQSAALLKQACESSGFFYVINHGISEKLINEVFAQVKKFFALPYDEKMKVGVRRSLIDEEAKSWNKSRGHGETFLALHTADQEVENFWPQSDLSPGWKETMLRYNQETLNLSKAITRIIAAALDLRIDFFDEPELLGKAQSILGLNYYGVEGNDHSNEYIIGSPPHSDPHIITLLATDDVQGLQICRDMNAKPPLWKNVLQLKGAFIVNIGDMLERMSNDIFRSTIHRVVFRQERYSVASFIYPSRDGIIECLPSCKSAENPPKYPPVKCDEFMEKHLSKYNKN